MKPQLLLCDEPTSGLDVATINDVVELHKKVRVVGVSMMIASHDLEFLCKLCDRVVLLKLGKLMVDINPRLVEDPVKSLHQYY